jgi:hypothetical protein
MTHVNFCGARAMAGWSPESMAEVSGYVAGDPAS